MADDARDAHAKKIAKKKDLKGASRPTRPASPSFVDHGDDPVPIASSAPTDANANSSQKSPRSKSQNPQKKLKKKHSEEKNEEKNFVKDVTLSSEKSQKRALQQEKKSAPRDALASDKKTSKKPKTTEVDDAPAPVQRENLALKGKKRLQDAKGAEETEQKKHKKKKQESPNPESAVDMEKDEVEVDAADAEMNPAKQGKLAEVKKRVQEARALAKSEGREYSDEGIANELSLPLRAVEVATKEIRKDKHRSRSIRSNKETKALVEMANLHGNNSLDQHRPILTISETNRLLRMLPNAERGLPSITSDAYAAIAVQKCVPITTQGSEILRATAEQFIKNILPFAVQVAANGTTASTIKVQAHHMDMATERYQGQMRWPTNQLSYGMLMHAQNNARDFLMEDATDEERWVKNKEVANDSANKNTAYKYELEEVMKEASTNGNGTAKRDHLNSVLRDKYRFSEADLAPLTSATDDA